MGLNFSCMRLCHRNTQTPDLLNPQVWILLFLFVFWGHYRLSGTCSCRKEGIGHGWIVGYVSIFVLSPLSNRIVCFVGPISPRVLELVGCSTGWLSRTHTRSLVARRFTAWASTAVAFFLYWIQVRLLLNFYSTSGVLAISHFPLVPIVYLFLLHKK